MKPGPPALCRGTVSHRRLSPAAHAFTHDVVYVWFDPDRPESLTDRHWTWSTGRFRPARIVADDYGWPGDEPVATWIEGLLRLVEPDFAVGEVRFLTQPRRWGWLFNPISLYLVWPPGSDDRPTGAVLEVTNTPWKERHHYVVTLESGDTIDAPETTVVEATFSKDLHVSPFLPSAMTYHLQISERPPASDGAGPRLDIAISVSDEAGDTVLETGMKMVRQPATGEGLVGTLRRDAFPTHRTSVGIHYQAARLLAKGVPFVPHPKRSKSRGST
ncbi:MAG: DUF1365 domain-containing protein [Acidimicrobiia bacterium]|nr:DUF1365 domain-containing protein [Acidimicrobiia bacterium]